VVHDDGGAQAFASAPAGGRHPGRVPHPRGGGLPRRRHDRPLRAPVTVRALPASVQLQGRLLRRRHAVREASRRRALHHQLERGGHDPGVPGGAPRRATAHARRRAGHLRRRGARRGGVCAVGRRRVVRLHQARRLVLRQRDAAAQQGAQWRHAERLMTAGHEFGRRLNN
jgi:hypothetical protein